MAYIYKGLDGDKLLILDDEDFVTESISYSDIQYLMLDGTKIQGLSLKRNKVYAGDICLEPKKTRNTNLTDAKKAKNDEFYTQLSDIEKELSHYPIETFKDKVIYCPMDVATNTGAILQSQFVKYFQMNAHRLQFKKLIATCLVEKATGDGVDIETAQNCYILERKTVPMSQRYIHSYMNDEGRSNPVVSEVDDFGIKYIREDNSQHPVPYHIVNQAVTEPDGKITIIAQYIDHYDECTGKPVICDTYKGVNWVFKGHTLKIKWCRKHPNGELEVLPDECYFFNNNDVINDFSVFPKDENGNPCYEDVDGGTVCLYPAEYYDYQELEYDDYEEYFAHCPEDSSEFGGSGDFRSDYCTRLLRECDVVVTNPPFSLFREFISWFSPYLDTKKIITLADQNVITFKEVFPLIKNNKLWIGTQTGITSMMFEVPEHYPVPDYAYDWCKKHTSPEYFAKHRLTYLRGISWFTNVDLDKRHEPLIGLNMLDLVEKGIEFPYYDNYDAIDVSKVKEIPMDYDGVMGVPITFIYNYNPDQFEILGCSNDLAESFINDEGKKCSGRFYINGKRMYDRIVIRHRKDENGRLV